MHYYPRLCCVRRSLHYGTIPTVLVVSWVVGVRLLPARERSGYVFVASCFQLWLVERPLEVVSHSSSMDSPETASGSFDPSTPAACPQVASSFSSATLQVYKGGEWSPFTGKDSPSLVEGKDVPRLVELRQCLFITCSLTVFTRPPDAF